MNREVGGYSGSEEASQQTVQRPESRTYAPRSSKVFYERAKAAGAFENVDDGTPILDARRQALLEAYMTTPVTYKDLRPLAGGVSPGRIVELLHTAFNRLARNLPQEMLDEYGIEPRRSSLSSHSSDIHALERPKKPGR